MQIRKYVVRSMQQGIKQVKDELGSNAVILTTRTIKKKNQKPLLEVTAAVDYDSDVLFKGRRKLKANPEPVPAPAPLPKTSKEPSGIDGGLHKILESLGGVNHRLGSIESGIQANGLSAKIDSLSLAINDIAHHLTSGNGYGRPIFSGEENLLFEKLVASGLDQTKAAELVQETVTELNEKSLPLDKHGDALLAEYIMKKVKLANIRRNGKRICALIGPTGMGKTTTIAKLAAEELLQYGRKIGFITIDTFRIGAVDQLRTYAKILQTPVEVAMDELDLSKKIKSMSDADTIFIDTAGISPHDNRMMTELAGYFDVDKRIEKHLVLSASTQLCDLRDMADRFKIVPADSIIVSKIDEVSRFGNVLSFLTDQRPAVSYFTTGQTVPEDIEEASKERVADMVLGISTAA